MTNPRKIRKLLVGLGAAGVLIGYRLSLHFGQKITVWGEDGRPVDMGLGAAQVYLSRLERWEWWG